jgi:hypothetical protein
LLKQPASRVKKQPDQAAHEKQRSRERTDWYF